MEKIFSKIKNTLKLPEKKKVSYDKTGIRPSRDWVVLLIVSNLIVLLSAIYAYYLYSKIDSDQFVVIDTLSKENETKINTDLLSRIVSDLNNRAGDFEKVKTGIVPGDPSL